MIERKRTETVYHDSLSREERLEWLMDEYGKHVIRLAYTYVRQNNLAEDIAQDVFIKCYENMDSFRNESSYKTWLFRITVNTCKDVLKSWTYKNVFSNDFVTSKLKQLDQSTESKIILHEENRFISEQVLSLPVKLREVIILHYYEGLHIDEISELLRLNRNTVKSRLHRARLKLKKLLEGGRYDES